MSGLWPLPRPRGGSSLCLPRLPSALSRPRVSPMQAGHSPKLPHPHGHCSLKPLSLLQNGAWSHDTGATQPGAGRDRGGRGHPPAGKGSAPSGEIQGQCQGELAGLERSLLPALGLRKKAVSEARGPGTQLQGAHGHQRPLAAGPPLGLRLPALQAGLPPPQRLTAALPASAAPPRPKAARALRPSPSLPCEFCFKGPGAVTFPAPLRNYRQTFRFFFFLS